jgi:hypothetical protein
MHLALKGSFVGVSTHLLYCNTYCEITCTSITSLQLPPRVTTRAPGKLSEDLNDEKSTKKNPRGICQT